MTTTLFLLLSTGPVLLQVCVILGALLLVGHVAIQLIPIAGAAVLRRTLLVAAAFVIHTDFRYGFAG
jgi:hypothetical protein